ncbi:MAG TPA: protein kinase [Candidatus Angelobacter sp.]|nr:protein kinase [Candidatus Angelobacter sp.]
MAITTGTRIGPYEIVALLGAGGMGEVYRARDERLSRDVAIKVLPGSVTSDPDRLRRFEQEARAAGQINHPNIMAVYDVGSYEGTPYIVSEYIEGETLRGALSDGPLPPARALEVGIEIASGLAAAHAKGIVHRDLKPENLILLRDGRVKILDFGIAKLTRDGMGKVTDTGPTLANLTVTGQLLGTASYMAPEQIRDLGVDHRTDLFTLGAILYEMLTGLPAFPGETVADRMSAILRAEPPALPREVEAAHPGLTKVLRRCLEKHADARLDSARDLALALDLVRESRGSGAESATATLKDVEYQKLTFRDGDITGARFTPDGQTVVYSAAWDGGGSEIYVARVEMPESRSIGLAGDLLSVASTSELAVLVEGMDTGGFVTLGTLARVSMLGGVPRRVIDRVSFADWSPDGKNMAVVRNQEGLFHLEYPIGRTIYRSHSWISHARVSRDGTRVGFLDHHALGDNSGNVIEIGPDLKPRTLSTGWSTAWGLTWSHRDTLCFSAQRVGSSPGIFEITREGTLRTLQRAAGHVYLADISPSGDVLFIQGTLQMKMEWHEPGEDVRDLSCLDWTLCRDISRDGKWILFDETGAASGGRASTYMRATDGSPAVRLGDGVAIEFSPDGQWALVDNRDESSGLMLLPIGAGRERSLRLPPMAVHHGTWTPDGRALVLSGVESGRGIRLYHFDLESESLRPISEEGVGVHLGLVSPDGKRVMARTAVGTYALYPIDGGPPQALEGIEPGERPHTWSADGTAIFAFERGKVPARIFRVEVATGTRELWHAVTPRFPSGVTGINSILLTQDGHAHAASYQRINVELCIARGVF